MGEPTRIPAYSVLSPACCVACNASSRRCSQPCSQPLLLPLAALSVTALTGRKIHVELVADCSLVLQPLFSIVVAIISRLRTTFDTAFQTETPPSCRTELIAAPSPPPPLPPPSPPPSPKSPPLSPQLEPPPPVFGVNTNVTLILLITTPVGASSPAFGSSHV